MAATPSSSDILDLNEIWEDERTEHSDPGVPHELPGSCPPVHLSTISEPEDEQEEADSGSHSESDNDEDSAQQGPGIPHSLSGGYLASLAAATAGDQSPYGSQLKQIPSVAIPARQRESPINNTCFNLGTSAPIAIPMSANRRSFVGMEAEDKRFASTFIPPHLMEQQRTAAELSGQLTYSGVSPSASVKRDRLVQRNAILRSTGFIEATTVHTGGFAETLDPIKESQLGGSGFPGEGGFALPMERPVGASALSKALDTLVGSDAAA